MHFELEVGSEEMDEERVVVRAILALNCVSILLSIKIKDRDVSVGLLRAWL